MRVENSDQTPWLWKQPAADFSERTHSGWPRETRVLVAPVREDVPIDVLDFPSDRRVQALPATEGERVFEVLAGHSYIVGLLGGTQAWTPREIAVPANAEQIDVVINSREVGRGTVLLETVDEHGGRRGDALMVRVEDPVHGLLLASLERSASEPWPLRFELPEGEFRIAVEGCANFDNFHGDLIRPRTLGRCDAVVRVTVDGEATLREAISVGARVRLQVEGAMRAEDLAGTLRSFGVLTTSSFEYWAERASIMLRADERWPQAVMFRSPGEYGEYLYSHVKLGTTQTSEVLPAGHFRLEARLRGGRVSRRTSCLSTAKLRM